MSLLRSPSEVWDTVQSVKNSGAVVKNGVLHLRSVFDKALLICEGGVVLLENTPILDIAGADAADHDNSERDGHTISYMGERPLVDGITLEAMPDFWLLRVDGVHDIPWASVGRTVIYNCMNAPFNDTLPPTRFCSPVVSKILVL